MDRREFSKQVVADEVLTALGAPVAQRVVEDRNRITGDGHQPIGLAAPDSEKDHVLDVEAVPPNPEDGIEFDLGDVKPGRKPDRAEPSSSRVEHLPVQGPVWFGPPVKRREPYAARRVNQELGKRRSSRWTWQGRDQVSV